MSVEAAVPRLGYLDFVKRRGRKPDRVNRVNTGVDWVQDAPAAEAPTRAASEATYYMVGRLAARALEEPSTFSVLASETGDAFGLHSVGSLPRGTQVVVSFAGPRHLSGLGLRMEDFRCEFDRGFQVQVKPPRPLTLSGRILLAHDWPSADVVWDSPAETETRYAPLVPTLRSRVSEPEPAQPAGEVVSRIVRPLAQPLDDVEEGDISGTSSIMRIGGLSTLVALMLAPLLLLVSVAGALAALFLGVASLALANYATYRLGESGWWLSPSIAVRIFTGSLALVVVAIVAAAAS